MRFSFLQRGVTRNPAGEAIVMVVGNEEKAEQKIIKVDRTVGDNWLVSQGLKPGDRVIVEGLQKARPGTPVKALLFESKSGAVPAGALKTAEAKQKGDLMSRFFINRPIFAWVIAIMAMLAATDMTSESLSIRHRAAHDRQSTPPIRAPRPRHAGYCHGR